MSTRAGSAIWHRARGTCNIGEGRGWPQTLAPYEGLGTAVAGLGDLDGDGIADVAVGAKGSLAAAGRFYITLLNNGGGAGS